MIMMILLCVMLTSYFKNDDRMNVLLKISSQRKKNLTIKDEEKLLKFIEFDFGSFLYIFFFW